MELISVIIPVYNVEKYLSECLDSVINQTYKNIEIILIDDGSKDSSGKICDEYAQKDTRFKVIHKENGGVSAARNTGLDVAQGAYITFVDADDFVERDFVENLYKKIQQESSDLCFSRYDKFNGHFIEVVEVFPDEPVTKNDINGFCDFYKRFFLTYSSKLHINHSSCRILYSKSLLTDLTFNTKIKMGEDMVFCLNAVTRANGISFVCESLYHYRINLSSACNASYYPDYFMGQLELIKEIKPLLKYYRGKDEKSFYQIYCAALCMDCIMNEVRGCKDKKKRRENIRKIRQSELYPYLKLKWGLGIHGIKRKVKFLVTWGLTKFRIV